MEPSYTLLYRPFLRTSFSYLEDEFEYAYSEHDVSYYKDQVKIFVGFEPDLVTVRYWLISEPRFTILPISVFLEMVNEEPYPLVADRAPVEDTIRIFGLFYKTKIDWIAKKLPDLVLPGLKWSFSRVLHVYGQTLNEVLEADDFKLILNYIYERDINWEP